ncbi:uncharacterized protein LOC127125988 isoform X3 [Lathyrus oleraceus]|uniref:uncharacterized protein LOC127125988 isoform X3 n=1 Tax=Pisum sativum TaxID=3888 RepID=UPI0021CE27C6|nr:uncharacterized protein LOC127125988 isoform X3 [Pisum sativum]
MKIDSNPMQAVEAHYAEPSVVNMVEAKVAPDGNSEMVEAPGSFDANVNMVEITDDLASQKRIETTEGFDKKDGDNAVENVEFRQEENWDRLGQPSGKYDYLVKYNAPESSQIDINAIQPSGWGEASSEDNEEIVDAIEHYPNTKEKVTEDLAIENKAAEGLGSDKTKKGDIANCVNTMGPFSKEVTKIKAEAANGPSKPVISGILRRTMEDPRRNWNKCYCKHGPRTISWCCCPEKEFDQTPQGVEGEEERLIRKMNELSIADKRNVGVNMVEISQRDQVEEGEDRRQKEYQRLAYPREEENLMEFIKRCQRMKTEVMLCPRCSAVFDRKAATNLEAADKTKRKEVGEQ